SAIDTGAHLNRRLLMFARHRKLEPVRLNLNVCIAGVTELLERTLGEQISLRSELARDLWTVEADPGEIDNALLNLAINARDAMLDGGTLTIKTRNVSLDAPAVRRLPDAKPGNFVCLSVIDTGQGMTPEVRRRAAEPFFTTKEPGKGTGLGLSSVYGFAQQSGGFLDLASEPGNRTTVAIYLPCATVEAALASPARTIDVAPQGKGELVLVVEDNDLVRKAMRARLEALGYVTLEARSGAEAVTVLKSDAPVSLVLSDIVMPGGMTGYDVACAAQSIRPG